MKITLAEKSKAVDISYAGIGNQDHFACWLLVTESHVA